MRQPNNSSINESKARLTKTAGTASVIGGLASFACLIYTLFKNSSSMEPSEKVGYFLPYAIPFGIAMLAFGVLGMIALTSSKEKTPYLLGGITAIAAGVCYIAEAFILGAMLGAWDFCISLAVIGFFIAMIGVVNLIPSKE